MALCWPLRMPPTAKSVLISLADNANDQGHCWPSIDTICERTCLGRTAVIDAIKELETAGHVSADRSNGRRTSYVIHPNQSASRTGEREQTSPPDVPVSDANQSATRTGPPDKPVRQTDQTSPPRGPDQSARRTLTVKNRQEPSGEGERSRGSRLPADFPTPTEIAFCRSERPDLDADLLAAKFRDYWLGVPGAKGRKCDWPATWRNFVRSEFSRAPPARASPSRAERLSATVAALTGRTPQAEVIDVTETATVRLG